MVVNLVIDTSGSMMESDKRLIARNLALVVVQYSRLGYAGMELRLLAAGAAPHVIDWDANAEYPEELLSCGGNIDMQALAVLLSTSKGKVVFITDGAWNESEKRAFEALLKSMPMGMVRIVKVGDERGCALHPFKTRGMVFDAEAIFEALDGLGDPPLNDQTEADEW